jgi:hypothetical protein
MGGACAPEDDNYRRFFAAAACGLEVEVRGAGHNALIDPGAAALQRSLCPPNEATAGEAGVRALYQGVVLALCESVMRPGGADVLSALRRKCDGAEGGGGSSGSSGSSSSGQQQQGLPTWATQRAPPPVYLPPGPLPPPTLQPAGADAALAARLGRTVAALKYQCAVLQGGLLDVGVRLKGFDGAGR